MFEPELLPRFHEHVEHVGGELSGDVQLPTQLTDERDAICSNTRVTQVDHLRGTEGECLVGEIVPRE